MDDHTLPRMPVVLTDPQPVGVKVTPTCEICHTAVPDLSDSRHHVCVPDSADATKWVKTTRDVGEANYRAEQAAADAAAKADVVP